jgi:hypothetical protein
MLVCALLEDVAVLENLDAILTVPGIDPPQGSGTTLTPTVSV